MISLLRKLIPDFILSWYHFLLAFLGAAIYGFPSRKLITIGITGTKGKSTVVHLATQILEKSGYKVASFSSIRFKIGKKEWPNMLKMTMPGRFKIQRFLKQAVGNGCKYAVLEVTSEGIKQHRHQFIDFIGAVFTNLAKEHIEAHGGFENYKRAKGELFKTLEMSEKKNLPRPFQEKGWGSFSIINLDDPNADYFLKFKTDEKYGYSLSPELEIKKAKSVDCLFHGIDSKSSEEKIEFTLNRLRFRVPLFGEFNIYNILAAICVGASQGISLEKMKDILKDAKGIPGRMELVIKKPFKVFVDYAHTPDSLENVYKTVSKLKTQSLKLLCVLGSCGGGRDKWRRPVLGGLADKYCDKIIITNEDPYDEDPKTIIDGVASGCKNKKPEKILDRREAIGRSLSLAKKNDVVAITGKGCEPWMCVAGGKKVVWDDRRIVREEFKKIHEKL